jgi:hypothetical protein
MCRSAFALVDLTQEWPLSRLDSAIRRLRAQRSCIDAAAVMVGARPGIVLELGLGNGRTYDHLRECLPDHEVFVFDRQVGAHPDSTPDADHLILGDLKLTLRESQSRFLGSVILVHSDVGTGDATTNAALTKFIGPILAPMLAPDAIVVSDQRFAIPDAVPVELPSDVPPGRYFMVKLVG